jgi:hypothetical protein
MDGCFLASCVSSAIIFEVETGNFYPNRILNAARSDSFELGRRLGNFGVLLPITGSGLCGFLRSKYAKAAFTPALRLISNALSCIEGWRRSLMEEINLTLCVLESNQNSASCLPKFKPVAIPLDAATCYRKHFGVKIKAIKILPFQSKAQMRQSVAQFKGCAQKGG